MSKNDEKPVEEDQTKDEQTAKFLHKLAESGKEYGLPKCLTAQYERNSWDNLKTDIPRFNCDKCGCPPPPPIDKKSTDSEPSKVCRNCEHVNRKPIGLQTEIYEMRLKEEVARKQEEKKAQKRSAPSEDTGDDDVIITPPKLAEVAPEVTAKQPTPQPPRQMPRKVAPQISRMEREKARMAREVANKQNPKSSMSKKPKLVTEKEPEFLQQLFGIGAKPS